MSSGSGAFHGISGGIAAVTLFVEDLEATKAYYARVFDLPVHYEDDASAVFEFGDAR